MAHAMLKYKHQLDSQDISLEICNEFLDGYYLPSEKKILLCANTLTNFEKTTKFEKAIKRNVKQLYNKKIINIYSKNFLAYFNV